jgi:hypothetical protein
VRKRELFAQSIGAPPVDPAQLVLSTWDGTLSWVTSYWR